MFKAVMNLEGRGKSKNYCWTPGNRDRNQMRQRPKEWNKEQHLLEIQEMGYNRTKPPDLGPGMCCTVGQFFPIEKNLPGNKVG